MSKITYAKGDATQPAGEGPRLIPHVCNNVGGWGSGFVLAISRRWPEPERRYREWVRTSTFHLGMVQPVKVERDLWVVNMVAQMGTRKRITDPPAIHYAHLRTCLDKLGRLAWSKGASIHAPKFGAGLAGGDWSIIEQMIQEELVDKGLDVTIYEFDG